MVSVSYPSFLLLDLSFLKWMLSESKEKDKIITALLHIHNSSKENKKRQNIVLNSDFEQIISEGLVKDKENIRGCFHPATFNEEIDNIIIKEKVTDYDKRGIMAIILSDEIPCKTVILTTQKEIKNYIDNPFFQKLKDISVKDEVDGFRLINNFFKKFCDEKEICQI